MTRECRGPKTSITFPDAFQPARSCTARAGRLDSSRPCCPPSDCITNQYHISRAPRGSHLQDLRQPQLPRRIPLQLHRRTKQNQQIRLARNMIIDLRINQLHIDLVLLHIAFLRHFRKGLRQVDDGVAAVVLGKKQHGKVLARGVWVRGGRGRVCARGRSRGRGLSRLRRGFGGGSS
jgi:hypothetical protein